MRDETPMVIDCETCPVREVRCADCLVTALRGLPVIALGAGELPLDAAERRAVHALIGAGLLPSDRAAVLTARREPWSRSRAVG